MEAPHVQRKAVVRGGGGITGIVLLVNCFLVNVKDDVEKLLMSVMMHQSVCVLEVGCFFFFFSTN